MGITYSSFLKLNISLAPLGIAWDGSAAAYFCTPKGARIIGWAGVDGIHYCFVRGFSEMVFAVSPMNPAPHFVHPLAENFSDFLRLLLACKSCDALEQAWQWDEGQFAGFLAENPPTEEQERILSQIAEKTCLLPIENPWQYIHSLQDSFDYEKLHFAESKQTPAKKTQKWRVCFNGSFWNHRSGKRAGKEQAVGKTFTWAGRHWIIPSIYLCSEGLVIDFCMQIDPSEIQAFMEKWNLNDLEETPQDFTQEQLLCMEAESPLHLDFHSALKLNERELESTHGCSITYNPLLSPGHTAECETNYVLDHYDLDPGFGWMIWRASYPWPVGQKTKIRTLSVTMEQDMISLPGPRFQVSAPGYTLHFTCPTDGREYTLTVQEYLPQTINTSHLLPEDMDFPEYYITMNYTITPEIPDGQMTVCDCKSSDAPRKKSQAGQTDGPDGPFSIAIIGGACGPARTAPASTAPISTASASPADAPAEMASGQNKEPCLQTAFSSLHFTPPEDVEWLMVFHKKQAGNAAFRLI